MILAIPSRMATAFVLFDSWLNDPTEADCVFSVCDALKFARVDFESKNVMQDTFVLIVPAG
jgi:hypothetical protein